MGSSGCDRFDWSNSHFLRSSTTTCRPLPRSVRAHCQQIRMLNSWWCYQVLRLVAYWELKEAAYAYGNTTMVCNGKSEIRLKSLSASWLLLALFRRLPPLPLHFFRWLAATGLMQWVSTTLPPLQPSHLQGSSNRCHCGGGRRAAGGRWAVGRAGGPGGGRRQLCKTRHLLRACVPGTVALVHAPYDVAVCCERRSLAGWTYQRQ
jgi:hypothetical protein